MALAEGKKGSCLSAAWNSSSSVIVMGVGFKVWSLGFGAWAFEEGLTQTCLGKHTPLRHFSNDTDITTNTDLVLGLLLHLPPQISLSPGFPGILVSRSTFKVLSLFNYPE